MALPNRRKRSSVVVLPWKLLLCSCSTGVIGFYTGLFLGASSAQTKSTVSQSLVVPHDTQRPFSDGLREVVTDYTELPRDEFAEYLNMGVPLDPSSRSNHQVLVLYQSESSKPDTLSNDPEAALRNCDQVHVVLTQPRHRKQCTILMGQYESFHVQKFMRLPLRGKLDSRLPLRFVNRGAQASGRKSTNPPTTEQTKEYWELLSDHLKHYSKMLEELGIVAKKVVSPSNTIVVMVCNFGQSELLLNFWCNAQHRNLDMSHILVFATDVETRDLLLKLTPFTVFFDENLSSSIPQGAARRYGDDIFAKVMLAKVHCVQSLVFLGYNVLFQDVDVIWFRDVLGYFETKHDEYDVYFQDDGNHALYYAPYSANTGFYYVNANERTRHLFNTLLLSGDIIASTKSHQIPLVSLLAEHSSMYGLKVKIWNRLENEFPGGHAFHRRRDFMKEIIAGRYVPYIFHMSWTTNKMESIIKYSTALVDNIS